MLFKGFVASERFASLLGRVDNILGVEFLGRNLSLSVQSILSPYKCLSCRCCRIMDPKHQRRNGTTTPTGSEIFPREPSGHA